MNIRLPANLDDEDITADMVDGPFPLSIPSGMSAFIHRVKISEICREVVDALPSQFSETKELDYDIILKMDRKFRHFLQELPVYFRLDPESMAKSESMFRNRPTLSLQRIGINFSARVRLCRLHRPYHLEGLTDPRYAYSHKACVQEAQRVLDLRRAMDECSAPLGMKPSRSWIVMQHVSIAALILATDVSFNPLAPNAEERKAKVLATCEILEKSIEESGSIMEGVQRNMHVLISTLQKQRSESLSQRVLAPGDIEINLGQPGDAVMVDDGYHASRSAGGHLTGTADRTDGFLDDLGAEKTDWDQLWRDFIAIAPELDMTHWDIFFEDVQPVH
jgi:hypothetical protein